MFEVIFSQDVDITPKEAVAMREMGTRPAAEGGMKLGIIPCAEITVGFIWPCGTMTIGGCGTILSEASANIPRLLGVSDAVSGVTLDPEKNKDIIQKMAVIGIKKSEKK